MPLVQIPVGIAPCQVDDFPEKVGKGKDAKPFERSCKGSLRLRPASTKVLTDHELDWLKEQKQWAHIGRRIHVVDVKIVTDPKSDRSLAKPKPGGPVEKAQAEAAAKKAALSKQPPEKPEEAPKAAPAAEEEAGESSSGRSRRRRGSE